MEMYFGYQSKLKIQKNYNNGYTNKNKNVYNY